MSGVIPPAPGGEEDFLWWGGRLSRDTLCRGRRVSFFLPREREGREGRALPPKKVWPFLPPGRRSRGGIFSLVRGAFPVGWEAAYTECPRVCRLQGEKCWRKPARFVARAHNWAILGAPPVWGVPPPGGWGAQLFLNRLFAQCCVVIPPKREGSPHQDKRWLLLPKSLPGFFKRGFFPEFYWGPLGGIYF